MDYIKMITQEFDSYREITDKVNEFDNKFYKYIEILENEEFLEKIIDYNKKYKLKENEYFLKFKKYTFEKNGKIIRTILGFPIKTKSGKVHKNLINWPSNYNSIYIFKDKPLSGHKIIDYRHGMSQSWLKMQHPIGFIYEISNANFVNIIDKIIINKGVIETPVMIDLNETTLKLRVKED
jgi:hypothetical protein